jgi:hypothetical protein
LNKYKLGHLEGNFTPVLYIGRKVKVNNYIVCSDIIRVFGIRIDYVGSGGRIIMKFYMYDLSVYHIC